MTSTPSSIEISTYNVERTVHRDFIIFLFPSIPGVVQITLYYINLFVISLLPVVLGNYR